MKVELTKSISDMIRATVASTHGSESSGLCFTKVATPQARLLEHLVQ